MYPALSGFQCPVQTRPGTRVFEFSQAKFILNCERGGVLVSGDVHVLADRFFFFFFFLSLNFAMVARSPQKIRVFASERFEKALLGIAHSSKR